jgi:ketosteroid isomerase-like protein
MASFFGGTMRRGILTWLGYALAAVALVGIGVAARADEGADLLKVREQVWRAWFANDKKSLEELVPPETIVISSGEQKWKNRAEVLQSAADFQAAGGKLVRLEFPRTEVQHFGDVAIIWSEYVVETEMNGKRSTSSGRVTEIFVKRNGKWTNPGWHTDSEKSAT